MNYLLTIFLFAISIALGVWGYFLRDDSFGVLAASVIVGAGALGSLQRGRLRRRRQLRRGDFDFLSGQLISLGLEEVDIEELQTALKADPPMEIVRKRFTVTGDSFSAGDQVSAWTIKMLERRAEQVDRETLEQWEQLVGTAILEYYGWD